MTEFYRDRSVYGITGTAVEDEYRYPELIQWSLGFYREAVFVYRENEFKSLRAVNWLGNEILFMTPRFEGAADRFRYTFYDSVWHYYPVQGEWRLRTRQLPEEIFETGRATQLFEYDALGRLMKEGFDLNGNWMLDMLSAEPITTYDRQFQQHNGTGPWEDVSTVERYLQDNSATKTLVKRTRTRVPAALTGDEVSKTFTELPGGGITVATVSIDRTDTSPTFGDETSVIDDQEHGQTWTRVHRDGLLRSETQPGVATARTYAYTALGELETLNDPLTGSLTYAYDASTRWLASVTDSLSRETAYDYFPAGSANAGRLRGVRDPENNWTRFDYYPAGQVFRQWGVNTYPVEYEYNEAGDMTQMKTFRTTPGTVNWASATWPDPSGGDVTEWVYDGPSGLLERKKYPNAGAGQKTTIYTYDAGHFLDTKVNGRQQTINYGFDTLGLLRTITYSDGTPSVTLTYDRAGRLQTVTDAAGIQSVTWTERDQMKLEEYTSGLLAGVAVDRTYDSAFRLERLEYKQGGNTRTRQRFAYDGISWLDYIANETPDGATELHRFDYTFKANTPFVQSIESIRAGTSVLLQSYDRDGLGRVAGAGAALTGGGAVYGVDYQFDDLNRRRQADLADGTYWDYGYNDRGEVTAGKRHLDATTFAGGKQFEYNYDDIGNRLVARFGGDAAGGNLSESVYNPANALNQLTARTVPGEIWLTGEAPGTLSLEGVAEGGAFAVEQQAGDRFYGMATVDNSAGPVRARITVAAKNNGTLTDFQTGHQFVAAEEENFGHDADGNLTSDGRWTYVWDAESRLIRVESATVVGPQRRVEFTYDWMGRRVGKKVWDNTAGSGNPVVDQRFVYDGWNLLAILDAASVLQQSFTWGLDLSGTMQGAGGVGGLLLVNDQITLNNQPSAHFTCYDGNGNVMGLVNAADGSVTAQYEYGPFGELLRASGPLAAANPFRFSTKWQDEETGLLYYGYRYYDPGTGRWLSRDPIGERGGRNLYGFVGNGSPNNIDYLGLAGYFFDGTNNDGDRDTDAPTNVKILHDIYLDEAFYKHGVGTRESSKLENIIGMATGKGGVARISDMMSELDDRIAVGDCTIDIFGFSRGSLSARDFANRVKDKYPYLRIRFLGIFDTVASVPNTWDYRQAIPDNVITVIHPIAAEERRRQFPLSSIKGAPKDLNYAKRDWWEFKLPGAHSDVGGGYKTRRQHANMALKIMHQQAVARGVPFGPIPDEYLNTETKGVDTHDSRWPTDKFLDYLDDRNGRSRRPREIIYFP